MMNSTFLLYNTRLNHLHEDASTVRACHDIYSASTGEQYPDYLHSRLQAACTAIIHGSPEYKVQEKWL